MNTGNIPFSILSLEAVLELAIQSGNTILAKHPEDPLLSSPFLSLKYPRQKAMLAIASSRKQELTQQVNNADFQRDQAFIGFRKHIEVYQFKVWDPAAKRASDNLLTIIKKHGAQLYKEGFSVQSALMTSLFQDLDTAQAQADLKTLGLEDWLAKLKQFQDRFSALFQQHNEIESEKDIPTEAEAKNELVESLSVLLNGLDFLANTQPEKYGETCNLIVEITARIVASEKRR